jgi:phosphonate transport system ATP-binding protein
VRVDHLSVAYDRGVIALDGVTLEVRPGEVVAITGPSGSGKTTLLHAIAGQVRATGGHASADGRVALLYQDFRLVGRATALRNVLHGAAARVGLASSLLGYPRAERARALALLARLGLEQRIDQRVDRLSGGEQQRVALARALMREPAVLLADEPVSSLDPASAHALLRLLREFARERDLAVVCVLHDTALAARYADRVITLRQGRTAPASVSPDLAAAASRPAPPPPANDEGVARFAEATGSEPPSGWAAWGLRALGLGAVALGTAWAWSVLDIDWPRQGPEAAGRFLAALVPSAAQLATLDAAALGRALVVTLAMAWLGTLIATFVALPLAALAARGVAPGWLRAATRGVLNAIRAVPSLLWALLAVGAFGLGVLPGVVALAAYSLGYLTKFYYEAFESVDPRVPDALRALGLGRAQVFLSGIVPGSHLALLSSTIFMLEYNFRTATVLGIVGAGGIGYELKLAVDWGNWHVVGSILAVLIAAVLVFDAIAARLRRALR